MDDEITVIRVVLPETNVVRITTASACISNAGGTANVVFSNPGGRLTTESGVPVSTSDRTSQGTIYYTPYKHNNIYTYSGSTWQQKTFSEISLTLSTTSGKNYDVFIDSDATTLSLSSAWSSDTARLDALGTQDGVTVLSSDHTKLWLGTIRASGSNVTEDSAGGSSSQVGGKRFVWNAYNQVRRRIAVIDTTANWSYSSLSIRQANGASGNKVEYVSGDSTVLVDASALGYFFSQTMVGHGAHIGVGLDTITAFSGLVQHVSTVASGNFNQPSSGRYVGSPGLGYHYASWNEKGDTSVFFYGTDGEDGVSGLTLILLN